MTAASPRTAPHPIVAFIARQHGMAARLLAEHVDDGSGRCRLCSGGAQTGHHRWPCRLHHYARAALGQVR